MRETIFTEQALQAAQNAAGKVRNIRWAWSDIDIRTGRVLAAVESKPEIERARAALQQADLGRVPAERVDIFVSATAKQHAYGGLALTPPTGLGCTSGFTVLHIASGEEGIASAGHCPNNERLGHHPSVALTLMDEKDGQSADAQWYKTPGLNDEKIFQYNPDGSTRSVTSRVDRVNMSIGGLACIYGKTSGYGCSTIAAKNYDPDMGGSAYNATWIRMNEDITQQGDSGGPWFVGNAAYGIHTGDTVCGGGVPCQSIFMAQDFLTQALGVQVRIATN